MWFRLALGKWSSPMAAVIGREGRVYWRVVDVAHVLGKRSPHGFSQRYGGNLRGRDVLKEEASVSARQCRLLSTDDTYQLMLQQQGNVALAFRFALEQGRATCQPAVVGRGTSPKFSPLLTVDEAGGEIVIADWIAAYTEAVLEEQEEKQVVAPQELPEENILEWIQEDGSCIVWRGAQPEEFVGCTVQPGEWVVQVPPGQTLPPAVWLKSGESMRMYVKSETASPARETEGSEE